ncbi:MAG: iron-containing alcohol dehydrogenase [Pseudomonadota bacterium]
MAIINYLTHIRFDHGAIAHTHADACSTGMSHPLIVTDKGIREAGLLDQLLGHLPEDWHRSIYDNTPSNPTEEAVSEAHELFASQGCDGLIAIGGGSPIDLAKAVAVAARHTGQLTDFAFIEGGADLITDAVAPVVAIPTTAGTGSEVGRASLITLRDGRKLALISPHIIPARSICDPDLTVNSPSWLTAAAGMDALTHCIECYISPKVNPVADAISLDGAARAWRWIRTAYEEPTNKQARWEMMMAGTQGGLSFQKSLGAVHAMSHPLGSLQDPGFHHGMLNAVILPHVLRYHETAVDRHFAGLRDAFGLGFGADLPAAIEKLNRGLGLPKSLREMGVPEDCLPHMVEGALADHSNAGNPREVGRADYEALFQAAYG